MNNVLVHVKNRKHFWQFWKVDNFRKATEKEMLSIIVYTASLQDTYDNSTNPTIKG